MSPNLATRDRINVRTPTASGGGSLSGRPTRAKPNPPAVRVARDGSPEVRKERND